MWICIVNFKLLKIVFFFEGCEINFNEKLCICWIRFKIVENVYFNLNTVNKFSINFLGREDFGFLYIG